MAERRYPRFQKNLLVNISRNGFEGLGLVMNVSRRGVYVESVQVFPPDTRLSLLLAAGNNLIPLSGTVVWRKESNGDLSAGASGGMGIQIARVPGEYIRYLREVCDGENG